MPERMSPVISFMDTSHKIEFSAESCNERMNLGGSNLGDPTNNLTSGEISTRKKAYKDFVSQLPRVCSPTLCGMKTFQVVTPETERSMLDTNYQFEWSIGQKAILHPCDFSNELNHPLYEEEQESLRHERQKENDEFFSRSLIIPSPDLGAIRQESLVVSSKVPLALLQTEDASGSGAAFYSRDASFSTSIGFFSRNISKTPPTRDAIDGYFGVPDPDARVDESAFKTPIPLKGKQKKKLFEKCTKDALVISPDMMRDSHEDAIVSLDEASPHFSVSISPVMRIPGSRDGDFDSIDEERTEVMDSSTEYALKTMAHISPITGPHQNQMLSLEKFKTSTPGLNSGSWRGEGFKYRQYYQLYY